MTTLERFLNYIKIDTTSDEHSNTSPSTKNQIKLAKVLVSELQDLGMDEVIFDEEHGYVYAKLYGNELLPKVGFLSHLDTSSASSGKNIRPQIHTNYDGKPLTLTNGVILDPKDYDDLYNHIGKTLITSDGKTLLASDDKAGIAEIMSMLEYYQSSQKEHGDILVCFTPDEEISRGTKYLNYEIFNPDVAYTIDGASVGEFSYENFNATTITLDIKGIETHLGDAKGKMINAIKIATIIDSFIPKEFPETTEGKEGYYHLDELNGTPSHATMKYLIRDFYRLGFMERKRKIKQIVDKVNEMYPGSISMNIEDKYKNMYDEVAKNPNIINSTIEAIKNTGVTPIIEPIRGGTDGASISYHGIPCPNIGTGGHNFHSVFEYICEEDMEKALEILISIVDSYSMNNSFKR